MKKFLSLVCSISVVFMAFGCVMAEEEASVPYATYEATTEDGETVYGTLYNLGEYAPIAESDDSENSELTIDQRVTIRAKNAIAIQIGNYATVGHDKLKWVDKDNKNVKPYIKENRTMVPLRYIAEELGAEVGFDDATREVSITLGDKVFKVVIGASTYSINGESFSLDAPAEIVENRTFVPLRVISEAFDMSVTWLESNRMVIITPKDYPWNEDNAIDKETLSRINLLLSPLVKDLVGGN